jgi:4-hydroxy-tetrahydrodipicolinate synthase
MSQLSKALTGTGVALITPFTAKGDIDFPALKKVVENIIKGKCEYIVVLGTTGESAVLTSEEKKKIIKEVKALNKNRITLVLGIGGNNTAEVINDLKNYDLKGYSAILSVSPYYNKESISIMLQLPMLLLFLFYYITYQAEHPVIF